MSHSTFERAENDLTVSRDSAFKIHEMPDGRLMVDTPFYFNDGDGYEIQIRAIDDGWKLSDNGCAFWQLEMRTGFRDLRSEPMKSWIEAQLEYTPVLEARGELFADATSDQLLLRIIEMCIAIGHVVSLEDYIRALHEK